MKHASGAAAAKVSERVSSRGGHPQSGELAEQSVAKSDEWFECLFEKSPIAHVLADADWNLLRMNQSAGKLLNIGMLAAPQGGITSVRDLLGESVQTDLLDYFGNLEYSDSTCYETTVMLNRSVATEVHCQFTCLAMPPTNTSSRAFLLILSAAGRGLEKRATKDPEVIRAKSDFLAMMSHEIRTPMNSIVGFAELMRSTCENEEQATYLGQIESSAYVLFNLLNNILDFSKINSGEVAIKQNQFNIAEQLEVLAEEFRVCAQQKGVQLVCQVDPRLPRCVEVDEYCILQVIRNLLSNAVKFTDAGSIRVEVEFLGQEPECVRYAIHVMDTGIGIAQTDQAQVFQVFSQIDNSSTRRHGGTGLGLAIARKLTGMLGGELTVKSDLGKGAKFTLFLTSKIVPQELAQSESEMYIGSSAATYDNPSNLSKQEPRTSLRILLVEDDEVNQLLFITLLNRLGFKAEIASDGQEAYDRLQAEYFDLVFMDLQMPKMGGLEVTLRTRQSRRIPQPYFVAVTANTGAEVMDMCFNAGMDDYLSKPLTKEGVVQAILKFRERRSL